MRLRERGQRRAQLVARVRDEVALHPQRLGERAHRSARREPGDQSEEQDAHDAEHDDPGHDPIDVDDDVVAIAILTTGAASAPAPAGRSRGSPRPGSRPRGDDHGRCRADPQRRPPSPPPHAALVVGVRSCRRPDAVAAAAHGLDDLRRRLAPDVVHVGVDRARGVRRREDRVEDLVSREDMLGTLGEQARSARVSVSVSATRSPVGEYSDHDAGREQPLAEVPALALRAVAAQQRPKPRQQLVEVEGLDQIVVGTGIQPFDAVVDRAQGGEQQDRRRDPRRAHRRHELGRRPCRAAAGRRASGRSDRPSARARAGLAVGDMIDGVDVGEHLDRHLGDLGVVFDVQQGRMRGLVQDRSLRLTRSTSPLHRIPSKKAPRIVDLRDLRPAPTAAQGSGMELE